MIPLSATVVIARHVRPGRDAEYLRRQAEINDACRTFPGFETLEVVPPVPGVRDHHWSSSPSTPWIRRGRVCVAMDRKKFAEEATRLAIESVEKGWAGPFGAVVVKDGEIIGRGQNRVLLTGIPVFHAEVTAIIDASTRLNPKALLGSHYHAGTTLEMIPARRDRPIPCPSGPACSTAARRGR